MNIPERLEELREVLRSEHMSYGELAELQGLADHIDPDDVELLEAAGVPEHADDDSTWANGFGVWHVRVSRDTTGPLAVARRALRDELLARENDVARSVWMHPERVPDLDTPDTLVYREGKATDEESP